MASSIRTDAASQKPAAAKAAPVKPAAPAKSPAAPAKPPVTATKPPPPAPPQQQSAEEEPVEEVVVGSSVASRLVPPFAISMLVHIVALLALALIVTAPPKVEPPRLITSSSELESEDIGEDVPEETPQEEVTEATEASSDVVLPETTVSVDVQVAPAAEAVEAAAVDVEFSDFSTETAPTGTLLETVGAVGGQAGGIGARSNAAARKQLVARGGGNEQSETAVEAALKWLVLHQMPDGGWSFDMNDCCGGQCKHGGTLKADRGAATAMALLPFLGRGYTHTTGPYKEQVFKGINFLAALVVAGNGKMAGSGMYSQGIAGICLSESYAMTQDNRLQMPAQLALNYIMAAQDPVGGGWRYAPKQPGDTSAVGWQLMALKSGHMAYLDVNPLVIKKAVEFLDSVQADDGASYGYTGPGAGPATSAVGLLCRMYLGWKKDHPGLDRGVTKLAKMGPSKDLYFDYYATQVIHHVEGERWVAWNSKMRDMLTDAQVKSGHSAGSWYDGVDGGHGAHVAGRLYCTSLATMILEVYYRHLPIYGAQSVDEEFKE
jgi:hypothetical protein